MKIGGRIKNLATLVRAVGLGASILAGLGFILSGVGSYRGGGALIGTGFAILIGGTLSSLITALLLDGFGELIENSAVIANLMVKADTQESEAQNEDDKADAQKSESQSDAE